MQSKTNRLHHLTGDQAYLIYWMEFYDCKVRLETIMTMDLNLEIIVDYSWNFIAYRFDHPYDMVQMVRDDGKWMLTKASELLSADDMLRLELLCRNYAFN